MKILFIDTTLSGPIIGGAQTFLPTILKGINEKGNEVHLVTSGNLDKRVEKEICESGAIVHRKLWKRTAIVEDAAKIFAEWVNILKPNIYVVSVSWDIGWLVLPYLDPSIATYAIAHSNNNAFYFPVKHYRSFLTGVIGVSHEICNKINSVAEINFNRISWVPYGIVPSELFLKRNDKSRLQLIFVGRLEELDKRISDVAEIIKKLEAEKLNYLFQIIGDGSRLSHLKDLLADEIELGRVQITGWLQNDEILIKLRQSDIFILTSSSEGFSISLTEAMANGCCPIVTNIPSGSIQLIKNNSNGCLLPVGDTDGFVKKILYLAKHRDLLEKMRFAAWEVGKQFSIDKMVGRYLEIFRKGIEEVITIRRISKPGFTVMQSCRSKYPKWIRRIIRQLK